jgi:hypothetical protein
MMRFKNYILIIILVSIKLHAQVPEGFKQLVLPEQPIVDQQIESTHPGWRVALEKNQHVLKSITVYDGDPEELASLVPDKTIKDKGKIYSVWNFDPKSERNIWIKCEFSGTNISLSKSFPISIKELRIYYNPNIMIDGNRQIEKILFR